MVRNEDFDNLTLDGDSVATGTDLAAKADQDGTGTAELQNYGSIDTSELSVSGWELVDVVSEGVDPTGTNSVSDLISGLIADNRLLVFPPGDYRLTTPITGPVSDFGIIGLGDVTFVVDGLNSTALYLGDVAGGYENIAVSGIKFDISATGEGTRCLQAIVDDGLYVEDIRVTGVHDNPDGSGSSRFDILNPDGSGTIQNYVAADGSSLATSETHGPLGMLLSAEHQGTMYIDNCVLKGWSDFGIRNSGGKMIVTGGEFANNGTDCVRFSGSGGSSLRDATVYVDDTSLSTVNSRGIWIREPDVAIDNVHVRAEGDIGSGIPIEFSDDCSNVTIRNSSITVSGGVTHEALRTDGLSDHLSRPVLDNVSIDVSYSTGETRAVELHVPTVIRDCNLHATNSNGDCIGISARSGDMHHKIDGGTYVSDRLPISFGESTNEYAKVLNVDYAESLDGSTDEIVVSVDQQCWIKNNTVATGITQTGALATADAYVSNNQII